MKFIVDLPDEAVNEAWSEEEVIDALRYAASNLTHPNDGSPAYLAAMVERHAEGATEPKP